MRTMVHFLKNKLFEIGTILCFVLPPVGILLLLVLSFITIFQKWRNKQFNYSLLSFFFMCLFISTIGAVVHMKNLVLLIDSVMILVYWGIYLRISSTASNETFRFFKWTMIFGGLYNCIIGWSYQGMTMHPILEFLTGTKLFADMIPQNYTRLIGSSYNPNFTMHLLLIAVALLFAEILSTLRKRQWKHVSWQIPLLLVLSNGVVSTGSRAGFIIMICIYLLFFLRLNKIFFFVSAAVTILLSKPLMQLMPRNDSIDNSFNVREGIWKNSIELWNEHFLFGTTPHGFKSAYAKLFPDPVPHAHNLFIGFFAEFGMIGGIAFLIVLGVTVLNIVHLLIFNNKNDSLLEYFLLSLPIMVLTGILDEPTFSPQIGLLSIMLMSHWDLYYKKQVKTYPVQEMAYYIFYKKKNYSKF